MNRGQVRLPAILSSGRLWVCFLNIPLHELGDRLDEVPHAEVWVHCGSGYRASIAASMIDRIARTVVLINDDFEKASEHGLTA